MSRSNTSASKSRIDSSSAMDSTTRSSTAISRTSPCLLSDRLSDFLGERVRIRDHRGRAQGPDHAVTHEDRSVDDRRADVVAARYVHKMRYGIIVGRLARRRHRYGDEIGALAGLERTDLALHAEDAGAADGGQVERRRRRHGPRVVRHMLGEKGGLPHRLEHIEIVVAGGAIGAKPQRD